MRRVAFCILALSIALFTARCGDSGGGGNGQENDVATGEDATDATGDTGVTPSDTAQDVSTEDVAAPDDAADVPSPEDTADVPQPQDTAQDVPMDGDVAGTDADTVEPPPCDNDNDCLDLIPEGELCQVAVCNDGQCALEPKDCNDDDNCTFDTCDPATGACEYTPNPQCGCTVDADCPEDANPCTVRKCLDIDAVSELGRCGFEPTTQACDDNNPCTEGEACMADPANEENGICGGGDPRNCDDGDDTTFDICDPTAAPDVCVHQAVTACPNGQSDCPAATQCAEFICDEDTENPVCQPTVREGESCDDNDFCSDDTTCQADGTCAGGTPHDCDDGDPATNDSCDSVAGECKHPIGGDVPCATVNDCNTVLGPPENTCQVRECREGYCRLVDAQNASCNDGDFCTENDFCQAGQCISGPPRDCSLECPEGATAICSSETSECICEEQPVCQIDNPENCSSGSDCDDGDPCTQDSCLTFRTPSLCVCTPREDCVRCDPANETGSGDNPTCDDGDESTMDYCCTAAGFAGDHPVEGCFASTVGACIHETDPLVCEFGACDPDAPACDDGDRCTLDECAFRGTTEGGDEVNCCEHPRVSPPTCNECTEANAAEACNDGDPCTPDTCNADGRCNPPGDPIEGCCLSDDDCTEDENICTTAACVDNACVQQDNNAACDDGDDCTQNDVCDQGTCAGETLVCDDFDECTDDECVQGQGCVYTPVDSPDCVLCYEREDPETFCEDGNPCTIDVCETNGACSHTDLNAEQDTLLCVQLNCRDEIDCDDGNPCTVDSCLPPENDPNPDDEEVPMGSCQYSEIADCEVPAQLACQEDSECDPVDCMPDDDRAFCNAPGELCPAIYCDADTGCRFPPTAGCDLISCTPVTAYIDCYDQNPCTDDTTACVDGECVDPEDASLRDAVVPDDNLFGGCLECETVQDCLDIAAGSDLIDVDDPCLVFECVVQDPYFVADDPDTGDPGPTIGACYAHIDQELFPNGCEDFDLCTIDTCVPDVGCDHEMRAADCAFCYSDGDCDDLDPCTVDTCDVVAGAGYGFGCTHEPVPDCMACDSNADCPAGDDLCTMWNCVAGFCEEPMFAAPGNPGVSCLAAGCSQQTDCDDGDPDTLDACSVGDGACIFAPDPAAPGFACSSPQDCVTDDPCMMPTGCNAGECQFMQVPDCTPTACTQGSDCVDGNPCTTDWCLNSECFNIPMGECCESAAACAAGADGGVWDGCTVPSCGTSGACEFVAFGRGNVECGGPCETNADCMRACNDQEDTNGNVFTVCTSFCLGDDECYDWPCAQGACTAQGRCVWFEGDCQGCTVDSDCVDADPCTLDTCVDGLCDHQTQDPCNATACDANDVCDDGDPCTLGLCFDGNCVWAPNPDCQ